MGIRGVSLLCLRKKDIVLLEEGGKSVPIQILDVIDFNSDRKRMTVIVRDENGQIIMYTKGADNIMVPRLKNDVANEITLKAMQSHLTSFSEQGLRTLVLAYKNLSEAEYTEFKKKFDSAAKSLADREGRLDRAADSFERDFALIGCSAIEDRLQDQVPETIDYLLRCGIRVWLLTGDKQETAINVGISCRLIQNEMLILKLSALNSNGVSEQLQEYSGVVLENPKKSAVLVVPGETLSVALESLTKEFLQLATSCSSVICCRVTPLQKALMVRLVKTELRKITLSIGDGANDVSMIQEADIGVGIEGREGAQAVRAADYAFHEFRCLSRLLSVHGRYSLLRLSNLVFYSFYKNISFISTQFVFGQFNSWSGGVLKFIYFGDQNISIG
jgi:phospholipid-transporting ATPase